VEEPVTTTTKTKVAFRETANRDPLLAAVAESPTASTANTIPILSRAAG
jgi:hypothetical protein